MSSALIGRAPKGGLVQQMHCAATISMDGQRVTLLLAPDKLLGSASYLRQLNQFQPPFLHARGESDSHVDGYFSPEPVLGHLFVGTRR